MHANAVFTKANMCRPARPSLTGAQKAKLQPQRQKYFMTQAGRKVLPLHTSKAEAIHAICRSTASLLI